MPWILTPALAYLLEAQRITREMEAQGIVLDRDQAHELARASLGPPRRWVEREPELSPEGRATLDRIVAERERARADHLALAHDHHQRPRAGTTAPEVFESPNTAGLEPGSDPSGSPPAPGTDDRNETFDEVAWYLKYVPDPDDSEWS
jgi:hypothetical protein